MIEGARLRASMNHAASSSTTKVKCGRNCCFTVLCVERGILLIENAAEALGAKYDEGQADSFGDMAVLSFNGNKIITTSGGGALVTNNQE